MNSRVRPYIPLPKPYPVHTFPFRLLEKWIWILRRCLLLTGLTIGLSGAKKVGQVTGGNSLLKLNKNYALGRKGTVIELPQDQVIYRYVRERGCWGLDESQFIAHHLMELGKIRNSRTALLDIGANTGLVTLQAMNLSNTDNEIFLFEPIPRHIQAIRHNCKNLSKLHINDFALSSENGLSKIFTEHTNHGNSSLILSMVPSVGSVETEIKLVNTTEYCDNFLNRFDHYVIKCDTQGMDARILSKVPNRIWEVVECAIIEVSAIPEISEEEVDKLLSMCHEFQYVSWSPRGGKKIQFQEIREFWLSKSKTHKNLFLSKSINQS